MYGCVCVCVCGEGVKGLQNEEGRLSLLTSGGRYTAHGAPSSSEAALPRGRRFARLAGQAAIYC